MMTRMIIRKAASVYFVLLLCVLTFFFAWTFSHEREGVQPFDPEMNAAHGSPAGGFRGPNSIKIIHPSLGCPEMKLRGESFTARIEVPEEYAGISWGAELSTWYSNFRLNVSSAVFEPSFWLVDLEIPPYVLLDIYDLTITANGTAYTQPHSVSVISEFSEKFDFVHVTDIHIGNKSMDTYEDFGNIIRELNFIRPAFVINTGDVCDKLPDLYDMEDIPPEHQDEMYRYRVASDPGLGFPIYTVPGNHDYSYWPTTYIGDYEEFISPELNFAFDYGEQAHFIGIDSQVTWPMNDNGSSGGNGITDEQLAWIETELAANMDSKNQFTFMHHKPINTTYLTPFGNDTYLEQNAEEYRELMRAYNVTFSFHGHEHENRVHDKDFVDVIEDGSVDEREFPLFVLTESGTKEGWGGEEGFRLVRVNGSRIDSYTYDGDGNGVRDDLSAIPAGKINISFTPSNNGTAAEVTGRVVNELLEEFDHGFLEFIMPPLEPGESYGAVGEWRDLAGNLLLDRHLEVEQLINTPGEQCICRVRIDIREMSRANVTVKKILDDTPPEITHVWATKGNETGEYVRGHTVEFTVVEGHGTAGLQGNIAIRLAEPDGNGSVGSSEEFELVDDGWGVYRFIWDTAGCPGGVYHVETTLIDELGNGDHDGLPHSPDLEIRLIDNVAPEISRVASSVGNDTDGMYEIGSLVNITVTEAIGEEGLTGTVTINSDIIGGRVANGELKNAGSGIYYYIWNTNGSVPSADYEVETTLADISSNTDRDGLPGSPDLIMALVDETAPVILAVSSSVGLDTSGTYPPGSEVVIRVIEMYGETGLAGTIAISSAAGDIIVNETLMEGFEGSYYFIWNTKGFAAGEYLVETTLSDRYNNSDGDGLLGSDLAIVLLEPPDLTPPGAVLNIMAMDTPADNGNSVTVSWTPVDDTAGDFGHYSVYITKNDSVDPLQLEPEAAIQDISVKELSLTTCNGSSLEDGFSYYVTVMAFDLANNSNKGPQWVGPVVPRDDLPPMIEGRTPEMDEITVKGGEIIEFAVTVSPGEPDDLEFRWYLGQEIIYNGKNSFSFVAGEGPETHELRVIILDPAGNSHNYSWTINVITPTVDNGGDDAGKDEKGFLGPLMLWILVVIVVVGVAAVLFFFVHRRGKGENEHMGIEVGDEDDVEVGDEGEEFGNKMDDCEEWDGWV